MGANRVLGERRIRDAEGVEFEAPTIETRKRRGVRNGGGIPPHQPTKGYGERRKLFQRGPGRSSPRRKTICFQTVSERSYIKRRWSKSERNLSEIEQSLSELLTFLLFFCTRSVPLWPWPLTSWPWNFTALRVCVWTLYKIWTKSNNPRLSYRRFSTFRSAILGSGAQLTELSQGCVDATSPNLARTGRSSQHCTFVSDFGYLAAFSTRAAQSRVMLKTTPNFALFTFCEN